MTRTIETLERRTHLAATDLVAYAGGAGGQRFSAAHPLSDGTVLVAGAADDLAWLPAGVPVTTFAGPGVDAINSSGTASVGFLLRFSADLATITHAYAFADGKVDSIDRIRSTEVPGQATGTLYVSGRRTASGVGDGYFIAKLSGNGVDAPITNVAWGINADTRGAGDHEFLQPWDVRSDGRVVYAIGDTNGANWGQIGVLDAATGQPTTMEHWPNHWGSAGEKPNVAASAYPGTVSYSGIVLKLGRSGSLRSYTQADFDAYGPDENDNPRKSKYPDDLFFNGPQNAAGVSTGGYTGYRTAGSQGVTARVGDVVVDRRTNDLYYGYNYKSVLPDGNPDFEPAVVAMDSSGQMKWWARMYREFTDSNGNGVFDAGEPRNSTPDQYVDALAVDYANDRLTILARTHGNNVNNFFSGNALAASPGTNGFQNQWTGNAGNIHIHWLGKYGLDDGKVYAASYLGDYADGTTGQTTQFGTGSNLAGWANPNAGWPTLNTTRTDSYELAVDDAGRTYVSFVSRRPFTTTDAWMQMRKPSEGASAWSSVVRVYDATLSSLAYSSIVRGAWDPADPATTGNNTELSAFVPLPGGTAIALGYNEVDGTTGAPVGNALATQNVPGQWGRATPTGRDAIVARLAVVASPVDTTPPSVSTSTFAYLEAPARVRITFSESIVGLTADDLIVRRTSDDAIVPVTTFAYDAATRTARFDLATVAGRLSDGDYTASLAAGAFADAAGNASTAAHALSFFTLAGDANRDRAVDFADILILAANYGQASGRTWSTGDFDYDGATDFDDLLTLAGRYGTSLAVQPIDARRRTASVLQHAGRTSP